MGIVSCWPYIRKFVINIIKYVAISHGTYDKTDRTQSQQERDSFDKKLSTQMALLDINK